MAGRAAVAAAAADGRGTVEYADRPRQDRRHRVLGARSRRADHGGQRQLRAPRASGSTTARAGASSRACAAQPTGASRGPVPTNSGRSPTGGRAQAIAAGNERPPLEDNTLCHFAPGPEGRMQVVASYASPAFLSTSYQAMHAAACIEPNDCWFGGERLPEPQIGAFQLHWNGHALEPEPYLPEGHVVRGMVPFAGRLFESVSLLASDPVETPLRHPPPLRIINPAGIGARLSKASKNCRSTGRKSSRSRSTSCTSAATQKRCGPPAAPCSERSRDPNPRA